MAPTTDEELKLRLFPGDISQLGPAERFLKTLVDIPFAFKRIESLIFMGSHQEDMSSIKDSFKTLEVRYQILDLKEPKEKNYCHFLIYICSILHMDLGKLHK